jgi:hypothetical protein
MLTHSHPFHALPLPFHSAFILLPAEDLIPEEAVARLPVKIFVFAVYLLSCDELREEDETREGTFARAVQLLRREEGT